MSMRSPGGRRVFLCSVPPEEHALCLALVEALSPLRRSGLITLWSDAELQAGYDMIQETTRQLQAAQILLLPMSPACLASSDWNRQAELMLACAHRGQAHLIPVLLRPMAGWQETPFGHLSPLPVDGRAVTTFRNQGEGWFAVANGLRTLLLQDQIQPAAPVLQEQGGAAAGSRRLLTQPPLPHPVKSVPRPQAVAEVYRHLSGTAVSALVLTGVWGVGKSELAAQVCQFAEQQRQSDQGPFLAAPLWLTLEETTSLAEVCTALAQAAEEEHDFWRMTPSDLVVTLYDLLQDAQPRLLVLDQFERWLDPQTGLPRPEHAIVSTWLELLNSRPCSCRLLLNSQLYPHGRHRPLDRYVQRFALSGLSQSEGLLLLRQSRSHESDTELAAPVSYYQGHPLALAWLRDLLYGNRVVSLTALLQESSYKQRFANDRALAVLHYIYTQQLTNLQRELLQAFAIYRQSVPLHAAQRIVIARQSQPAQQIGAALSVLLDLDLLQIVDLLTYRVQSVIRDFIQAHPGTDEFSGTAERLALAHQTAATFYQELSAAPVHSLTSTPRNDALLRLEAAWHLCQAGRSAESVHLLHSADLFRQLSRQGESALLLDLYRCLLPAETWDAAPALAGRLYREMGTLYTALGQQLEARVACERSVTLLRGTGELPLLAEALNDLGAVYRALDQHTLASACYQEALVLCQQAGDPFPQRGITLNNQGRLLYEQAVALERRGEKVQAGALYREALAHYEQALAAHQRNQLSEEEGWTQLNLADVYASLGEQSQALAYYHLALACFRDLGERRGEGTVLNNLALLLTYDPASREQAADCYTQALRIFRAVADRRQERQTLHNLGHWLLVATPHKEPARSQAFLTSVACFFAASDPLTSPARTRTDALPVWVLATLRHELGEAETERCLQIAETRTRQLIEEFCNFPRAFV